MARTACSGDDEGFDIQIQFHSLDEDLEYVGEDANPCRHHQFQIMHPAIFPEFGIVAGILPVDDPSNRGAFNHNVAREKVAMGQVDFCVCGKTTEQDIHILFSTEVEE